MRPTWRLLYLAFVTLAAVLLLTSALAAAPAPSSEVPAPTEGEVAAQWPQPAVQALSQAGPGGQISLPAAPPQPETDPCLHCHLSGSNEGLWTPLARWSVFGAFGLVFAFGMYRSASVWTARTPWVPLRLRASAWLDERYNISEPLAKVLNKPVPRYALRWWYCLGGMTAFLFVVQAVTGIMLAFFYKPTPEAAYASIQYIETQVRFGSGVRAVHHWAANGMIVLCLGHMLRVFIMGAFKPPRELNWVSGVLLLLLTLLFGFTGYLLPWDQRAYWATTVGTEIAGATPEVGNLALLFLRVGWGITDLTLSRFYALHTIGLPILTLALMGLHFLMVRRQGIAEPL